MRNFYGEGNLPSSPECCARERASRGTTITPTFLLHPIVSDSHTLIVSCDHKRFAWQQLNYVVFELNIALWRLKFDIRLSIIKPPMPLSSIIDELQPFSSIWRIFRSNSGTFNGNTFQFKIHQIFLIRLSPLIVLLLLM